MRHTAPQAFRLLLTLTLVGACTPHAWSPPGRTLPLETAAAMEAGRTGVQLEGGSSGGVSAPSVAHATARIRHGLGADTELSIEGNAIVALEHSGTGTHRGIYSGRLGVKHAFGSHFALTGGMAAGGSAGGSFVSPDVGAIVGYENPYFVPFVSVRAILSAPVRARTIGIVDRDPWTYDEQLILVSPQLSYGCALATGFRLPIGRRDVPSRFALLAGVGYTFLTDSERSTHYIGGNFGLEVVL